MNQVILLNKLLTRKSLYFGLITLANLKRKIFFRRQLCEEKLTLDIPKLLKKSELSNEIFHRATYHLGSLWSKGSKCF